MAFALFLNGPQRRSIEINECSTPEAVLRNDHRNAQASSQCRFTRKGSRMTNATQLPNQQVTWRYLSKSVEEFADWQKRTNGKWADERTELLVYLQDQLRLEGEALNGGSFNHQVLGLLSYMSEQNNRMQELLLAYLSIAVARDIGPAKKIVAGHRLAGGLHPEYVAETRCYGNQ